MLHHQSCILLTSAASQSTADQSAVCRKIYEVDLHIRIAIAPPPSIRCSWLQRPLSCERKLQKWLYLPDRSLDILDCRSRSIACLPSVLDYRHLASCRPGERRSAVSTKTLKPLTYRLTLRQSTCPNGQQPKGRHYGHDHRCLCLRS